MKKIIKDEKGIVRKVQTVNNEPTMTQQHFQQECDINYIIDKYNRTGNISHLAKFRGVYADLSNQKDYATCLQTVINAKNAFEGLPSKVRQRFANDPSLLLSFLEDPKNRDEAVSLGLVEKQLPETPPPQNPPQTPPSPK